LQITGNGKARNPRAGSLAYCSVFGVHLHIVYGQYATRTYSNNFDAGRTVSELGYYYDFNGDTTYDNTGDNYNNGLFEVQEVTETRSSGAWQAYEYAYTNYTGSGVNNYIMNNLYTNTANGDVYQTYAYDDIASGVEWYLDVYTAGGSSAYTQGAQMVDYGTDTATYIWVPGINQWYLLNVAPN
jgi:hypothetical protein